MQLSQKYRLLNHLVVEGSISGVEASALYKCRSLTKRISELRDEGFDIYSEWKTDPTGQRYVRYWLRKLKKAKPKNKTKRTKRKAA